jgi:hypothetical protein
MRADGTSFSIGHQRRRDGSGRHQPNQHRRRGGGVTASFATTGNGIVLTDSPEAGTMTVSAANFSDAAKDLGLSSRPLATSSPATT